jgi:hypothetical protein
MLKFSGLPFMAYGDLKLPRTDIRGENLYVEGEKEPYFRIPEHWVWMNVGEIIVGGGFEKLRGDSVTAFKPRRLRIEGRAAFEHGDSFAEIGYQTDPKTPIHVSFNTNSENRHHWQANIGLLPFDAIGDEYFYVEFYLPEPEFADLLTIARAGSLDNIRLAMTTTMWTKNHPISVSHFHGNADLYLYQDSFSSERATLQSLQWTERFNAKPLQPQSPSPISNPDVGKAPKPTLIERTTG